MEELLRLIKSNDDVSYRQAAEKTAELGAAAFSFLVKSFKETADPAARARIVKISAGIEDPEVPNFLKEALEDQDFEVRRAAALSLKILTNEDYFPEIYHSNIGQMFVRNFWCNLDFIDEEVRNTFSFSNKSISKRFSQFFKDLSSRWTYTEPESPQFFSYRKKRNLKMAEDGRILYKNFNYALHKMLKSAKNINYLVESLVKVIDATDPQESEKRDIINCLKTAMGSHFGKLEEGLSVFCACFHLIRSEFSLALHTRPSHFLPPVENDLTAEERSLLKKLEQDFSRVEELGKNLGPDAEKIPHNLVMLKKYIEKFLNLCGEFGEMPEVCPENYRVFINMGSASYLMAFYNLHLICSWGAKA